MSLKRVILTTLIAASLFANDQRAAASPPPLECEISRGQWCILSHALQVTYDRLPGTDMVKWDIYQESVLPKGKFIVLESRACGEGPATATKVRYVDSDYRWSGESWKRIVVELSDDGACQLQLLHSNSVSSSRTKPFTVHGEYLVVCRSGGCCGAGKACEGPDFFDTVFSREFRSFWGP